MALRFHSLVSVLVSNQLWNEGPKARARILEEEFDAKITSLRTEATKAQAFFQK